ncbi:p-loop nucleoside triphosphate hydrolase superfamily protein [Quillaja saponaria]|uniref:P-loop nucleoside triphosphate hydrolase superfamily protein n=1 Tax=Quillaja saponaria TaxID=32244 RepID=A0AAD7LKU5_QUISA|nr:p-loop nucleoside triphosphate hydrolase superfamily protein [Quillaja saponaria]
MSSLEYLVIDEAAQLKECESTIPLQLPGLRHVVLIGDERQLSAVVKKPEVCLRDRYCWDTRSISLMSSTECIHPFSAFPNREFYDQNISDARNVRQRSYEKFFLEGNMFSSYSFINVAQGKEDSGRGHSLRNMVEVAAVSEIIARLYKEYSSTKRKISIGVISPYNSQILSLGTLGSAETSCKSDSIWKALVLNAKERDCFHDAYDDKNLAQAIDDALLKIDLDNPEPDPLSKAFSSLSLRSAAARSSYKKEGRFLKNSNWRSDDWVAGLLV